MRTKLLAGLAALSVVFSTLAAAPPALAAPVIQPGARHITSLGACTLNFVFDGTGAVAGDVFVGTAAHCVENVGDAVSVDGTQIGRVAVIDRATDNHKHDWALIQVHDNLESAVDPAVKGHASYPTGHTVGGEPLVGDLIQFSGYGVGWSFTSLTREQRKGVFLFGDADTYSVSGTATFGDSGGPLVHVPTGKALGIVSIISGGCGCDRGPTVEQIVERAAQLGFPVQLRTA